MTSYNSYMENLYLNEEKLGEFLSAIFGKSAVEKHPHIKLDEKIFKPDYRVGNTFFEFDGFRHFSNPSNMLRDLNLNIKTNYSVIQIPYFIQLDNFYQNYIFEELLDIKNFKSIEFINYPHGFCSKKIVYPAAFCSWGVRLFVGYLNLEDNNYIEHITKPILRSLFEARISTGLNICEIFPYSWIENILSSEKFDLESSVERLIIFLKKEYNV